MNRASPVDLRELLTAAENAAPAAAVDVVAEHLGRLIGSDYAAFWIADAAGQALLRLPDGLRRSASGTSVGTAWREQRVHRDGSWWLPVTARGDALGVLEVHLPDGVVEPADLVDHLSAVAHLLAYVVAANQRHTDEYETARRSQSFELAMEIQRRLLPQSFVCEGGSFTVAGWLEPSSSAGGDTFDYIASRDRLTLAMIDAVGHDVEAAMLATLTINAMRKARRDGGDLGTQAGAAQSALDLYGDDEDYATGVVLEVDIEAERASEGGPRAGTTPVRARMVNAGHPPPRLIRDGTLSPVQLDPDPPFGLDDQHRPYTVHDLELLPGDRLVLLTDGMYEKTAESFDLDSHLVRTAELHPRNAVQAIAQAFRDHVSDEPEDDATFVLLDWLGGTTSRQTEGGADRHPH